MVLRLGVGPLRFFIANCDVEERQFFFAGTERYVPTLLKES